MAIREKTRRMLEIAVEVLTENNPQTVRQVYYQLVARQIIENNRAQYQAVSTMLVEARRNGTVPWHWIEDRLRRPRAVSMWSDLSEFASDARHWYRRNVWDDQELYLEMWLEKDALSGIFEEILDEYGVTLNVGRGFDGWDSIHNAAARLSAPGSVVTYFGDFDPSGEDMVRSLRERLEDQGAYPEVIKCALNPDDIERYSLPPDFAKKTDSRAAAFIAKFGDISVELDALPINVLRQRITDEVESRMDLDALRLTQELQAEERRQLVEVLRGIS